MEFCGSWLHFFFINARNVVKKLFIKREVLVGILNNRFQKVIKNFIKVVYKKNKGNMEMKVIKVSIKENYLLNLILEIEEIVKDKYFEHIVSLFK